MNRTILLGIDAATWKVITPLLEEGELPTIASLLKEGVSAPLRSLPGYKSPALWTSIATGKSPEKNGVLYFSNLFLDLPRLKIKKDLTRSAVVDWPHRIGKLFSKNQKDPSKITSFSRKAYVYSMLKYGYFLEKFEMGGNYLITSASRKEKAIWDILSEEGFKVNVIGWLVTWPAEKINGVMVSQKGIEELSKYQNQSKFKVEKDKGSISYPYEIMEELKSFNKNPDSISDAELENFFNQLEIEEMKQLRSLEFDRKNKLKFFSQLYLIDEFTTQATVHLNDKYPSDFMTVYLPGLDGIQHLFWQYLFPKEFPFLKIEQKEIVKFGKVVKHYYKYLDLKIAALIKGFETVIIVSDHGMEAISERNFDHSAIRSGQHEMSPPGILIMKGPHLKKDLKLPEVHIFDLAPTILYLLGKEMDLGMDGEVITEAIKGDFLTKNPLRKKDYGKKEISENSVYDQKEQEEVKERLKALGYLD